MYNIDKNLKHYASRSKHYSTYRINKNGKPEQPNMELKRWSTKKESYVISDVREVVVEDETDWRYYWTSWSGYWRVSQQDGAFEILSKDIWDYQNPLKEIWIDYSDSIHKNMISNRISLTTERNYLGSNLDYFEMLDKARAKSVLRELIT